MGSNKSSRPTGMTTTIVMVTTLLMMVALVLGEVQYAKPNGDPGVKKCLKDCEKNCKANNSPEPDTRAAALHPSVRRLLLRSKAPLPFDRSSSDRPLWKTVIQRVSIGFFDDIFVPANQLPQPCHHIPDPDHRYKVKWIWEYDIEETGNLEQYNIDGLD
ncbi:hypothetical protein LINPERPRIM_LOCUS16601 [Linum perenne]